MVDLSSRQEQVADKHHHTIDRVEISINEIRTHDDLRLETTDAERPVPHTDTSWDAYRTLLATVFSNGLLFGKLLQHHVRTSAVADAHQESRCPSASSKTIIRAHSTSATVHPGSVSSVQAFPFWELH